MILSLQTHRAPADTWFPVLASSDLEPGAVLPVTVDSVRVAVWRSVAGDVSAWGDRCPHRGMRLSFGAVRGETLLCPYHGWTFDKTAQCTHMPAHPEIAPSKAACAHAFAVAERGAYIWVNLAGSTVARPPVVTATKVKAVRTLYVPLTTEATLAALLNFPLHDGASCTAAALPQLERQNNSADERLVFNGTYSDGASFVAAIGANAVDGAYSLDMKATGASGDVQYGVFVFPTTPGYSGVHVYTDLKDKLATATATGLDSKIDSGLAFRLNAGVVALRNGLSDDYTPERYSDALDAISAWRKTLHEPDIQRADDLEKMKCTK